MVNLDEKTDKVPLKGWKLQFGLWREGDREKSRAVLVVNTGESGTFEVPLPPGEYSELQFLGGNLPAGYTFTQNGYPVPAVTIVRDQRVDFPPVEIARRKQE
jgi:hypothetical protein